MSRASSSSRCATLRERGVDLTRYIGSHPLAGRERGGAISARADLFVGRPWVVAATRHLGCRPRARRGPRARPRCDAARDDARGARPLCRARVACAAACREPARRPVRRRPDGSLRLAGQGVRDTTRIAATAPELWVQILGANAAPVVDVLDALAARPRPSSPTPCAPRNTGARRPVADTIRRGNDGVESCPASTARIAVRSVVVMVDDTPGQLGRCSASSASSTSTSKMCASSTRRARSSASPRSASCPAPCVAPSRLEARGWKIASTTND